MLWCGRAVVDKEGLGEYVVYTPRYSPFLTFLACCRPGLRVVVGDARLKLAEAADGRYDVLVIDAFTSDAVPIHQMKAEAFAPYGTVVARDGVVIIHVTNHYLDLEPVVAAIGRAEGWTVRVRRYVPAGDRTGRIFDSASTWIDRKDTRRIFGPDNLVASPW